MAVTRAQKAETVADLNQNLQKATGIVLAHNLGLNAADISDLRKKVRGAKARFKVAKNRLIARALEGTQFKALDANLTGPTAIIYGEDIYALTKTIVGFAKTNDKLKVVAGATIDEIMDAKGVEAMSKMPSLNEARAALVGILQGAQSQLVRVLEAKITKDGGAGEQTAA